MAPYVLMLQTDVDDTELTQWALSGLQLALPVKFLDSLDEFEGFIELNGKPSLILLNENAKNTGIQIIRRLKTGQNYSDIPLVLLKENTLPAYINACYKAGASTVITKPSSLELTKKKIESFFYYWFDVAELPSFTSPISNSLDFKEVHTNDS